MFLVRLLRATAAFVPMLAVAGLTGGDANAQQIFRIDSPDGKVTFSDKVPVDPTLRATPTVSMPAAASDVDNSRFPFELRQAASRYPVTLYTGRDCDPCAQGRRLLSARGVPFTEKTVKSNEDIEALKRLSGAPSLPFLTIGGQQLRGFSEIEWAQFLDAAGYPRSSQLPANYRLPPAAPLVAVQEPKPPARAAEPAPAATVPVPARMPAEQPANPAGISF